jgi:hypothetical protein
LLIFHFPIPQWLSLNNPDGAVPCLLTSQPSVHF